MQSIWLTIIRCPYSVQAQILQGVFHSLCRAQNRLRTGANPLQMRIDYFSNIIGRNPHKNEKDIQNLVQVVACDSLDPTNSNRMPHLSSTQAHILVSSTMKILTIIQTAALLLIAGASVFAGIPDAGPSLLP
jgi:hypothetical protein